MSKDTSAKTSVGPNDPNFASVAVREKYKKYFPELTDDVVDRFLSFQSLLVRENSLLNLVPNQSIASAEVVHFFDCILAAKLIVPNLVPNEPVFVFGTGSGFPGLIIANLYPKLSVKIVSLEAKKAGFTKAASQSMKLSNVEFDTKPMESFGPHSMKNIVARGVTSISRGVLSARKAVPKGGKFFHMKGDGWSRELVELPVATLSYWAPKLVGQYRLPESGVQMAVILTEKIAE